MYFGDRPSTLFSLLLEVPHSEQDPVIAVLWENGTVGILEEEQSLFRAFFEKPEAAAAASERLIDFLVQMRQEEPGSNYPVQAGDFEPILIGNRFVVTSTESSAPLPPGRLPIRVDAQSAFGSGRHQSTQLMMQALEDYVRPDSVVVDVGCGSGILSLAAKQLGAKQVFACDIDPNAIGVSRNAAGSLLFAGSADGVETACADLVLANITAAVVDEIAVELNRIAKPGGRILISGFTGDRLPQRFHPETILDADDWQCWICRRDETLAHSSGVPRVHSLEWW